MPVYYNYYSRVCKTLHNFKEKVKLDLSKIKDNPGNLSLKDLNTNFENLKVFWRELMAEAFDVVCMSDATYKVCRRVFVDSMNSVYFKAASEFRDYTLDELKETDLRDLPKFVKSYIGKLFWVEGESGVEGILDEAGFNRLFDLLYKDRTFDVEFQVPVLIQNQPTKIMRAVFVMPDMTTVEQILNFFCNLECVYGASKSAGVLSPELPVGLDLDKFKPELKDFSDKSDWKGDALSAVDHLKSLLSNKSPLHDGMLLNIIQFIDRLALNLTVVVGCLAFHLQDIKQGGHFWERPVAYWKGHAQYAFGKADDREVPTKSDEKQ